MMPYLNSDLRSTCKPSITYGLQGEQVSIISRSDKVFIVENIAGNRYPVHQDELVENPPILSGSKQTIVNNQVAVKKQRKAAIEQTPSLFGL